VKKQQRFLHVGNRLAIDFGNTVADRDGKDGLVGWPDVVEFLLEAGIVDRTEAHRLRRFSEVDPGRATAAFRTAQELRDAVRELVSRIGSKKVVRPQVIDRINAIMRTGHGYHALSPRGAQWTVHFVQSSDEPVAALVPIARSAAEIIADPRAPNAIRKCANPECIRYFYDTSRVGKRRWCSMAVCGNRAKVAAHMERLRMRAASGGTEPKAGRFRSSRGSRRGSN
jgi:predicted RNA-binding Zn ribbon-like protein